VVANISTTRAIDDIAERHGCPVIRSKVGEINVVEEMIQNGAVVGERERRCDSPSHPSLPRQHVRDGAVLQLMAERKKPVSGILAGLPRYFMIKDKVVFLADGLAALHSALKKSFRDAEQQTLDV